MTSALLETTRTTTPIKLQIPDNALLSNEQLNILKYPQQKSWRSCRTFLFVGMLEQQGDHKACISVCITYVLTQSSMLGCFGLVMDSRLLDFDCLLAYQPFFQHLRAWMVLCWRWRMFEQGEEVKVRKSPNQTKPPRKFKPTSNPKQLYFKWKGQKNVQKWIVVQVHRE